MGMMIRWLLGFGELRGLVGCIGGWVCICDID